MIKSRFALITNISISQVPKENMIDKCLVIAMTANATFNDGQGVRNALEHGLVHLRANGWLDV